MIQKTLVKGYSHKNTQWELSNEHHHDRVDKIKKKYLCPCALDENTLSIGSHNILVRMSPFDSQRPVMLG